MPPVGLPQRPSTCVYGRSYFSVADALPHRGGRDGLVLASYHGNLGQAVAALRPSPRSSTATLRQPWCKVTAGEHL